MPGRPFSRPVLGVALLLLAVVAGCGTEASISERPEGATNPARAEAVLRAYLDRDRCDLLSDRLALQIAATAQAGRAACARGQLPVDALVRRGQYRVVSAEMIDAQGLFTIRLDDGGERDYTLTPGGRHAYLVDGVVTRTRAEFGEPLRLQAREAPDGPSLDARVTVGSLQRIKPQDLSEDEFVISALERYYKVRVQVRSRSDRPIRIDADDFYLAETNGFDVARPRVPYSDIGGLLPERVGPGRTVSGYLFFAVPQDKAANPAQVVLQVGTGNIGAKLVWTRP